MSEVLSNENLRRVHIGSPEAMDDFDFGGVMDVAGFTTDAEDPSLSFLNKKKRRAYKGKTIAETTIAPLFHATYHQGVIVPMLSRSLDFLLLIRLLKLRSCYAV
ncbi:hypothetical protein Adt_04084 [Abeliophyllum distichum]|uniref:Uncharacterized protein n=1 Tax=Abeliophyllum distichum TaxID=126358 RepID=A0ABD1W0C3_9LAMI